MFMTSCCYGNHTAEFGVFYVISTFSATGVLQNAKLSRSLLKSIMILYYGVIASLEPKKCNDYAKSVIVGISGKEMVG